MDKLKEISDLRIEDDLEIDKNCEQDKNRETGEEEEKLRRRHTRLAIENQ